METNYERSQRHMRTVLSAISKQHFERKPNLKPKPQPAARPQPTPQPKPHTTPDEMKKPAPSIRVTAEERRRMVKQHRKSNSLRRRTY